LSIEERSRYARQIGLRGFGAEAQVKLKEAAVLVVGAGGLSCPALLYLAAAGVGRLMVIDPDLVELSNLQRQVLYTEEDAGRPKARVAAGRLAALNPLIRIEALVDRLSRDNACSLIRSVDLVVDGCDNFATRYLVNDACAITDRPFVYGALQGFQGQLSVFNWRGGPTYRCLFPEPPPPGVAPNCAEAGVLGVLPGLIGTGQACEAIKILTGVGEPLSGRLLLWDALTMETRILRLERDPLRPRITELPPPGPGDSCSLNASKEINATDLGELLPDVQLIDVREAHERALGAIAPSIHLPLGELEGTAAEKALASLDIHKPVVAYCAGGIRSLKALGILESRYGFLRVLSLKGGYRAFIDRQK
jgi:adenylyltransferase/sulfurtransferase